MGYFNIRDERRNPLLTFVSFIWVPHNEGKSKFKDVESRKARRVFKYAYDSVCDSTCDAACLISLQM